MIALIHPYASLRVHDSVRTKLAPLGAGGMGEVWRARDTRLDRSVAIKILPDHFSNDARLKTRFQREARAISQLNHPHICTLFDVGHHGRRGQAAVMIPCAILTTFRGPLSSTKRRQAAALRRLAPSLAQEADEGG